MPPTTFFDRRPLPTLSRSAVASHEGMELVRKQQEEEEEEEGEEEEKKREEEEEGDEKK